MKKTFLAMMLMANTILCFGQSKVYVTHEISPEVLTPSNGLRRLALAQEFTNLSALTRNNPT